MTWQKLSEKHPDPDVKVFVSASPRQQHAGLMLQQVNADGTTIWRDSAGCVYHLGDVYWSYGPREE